MDEYRKEVLWFGATPDSTTEQEFANRRLVLRVLSAGELPVLTTVTAAIFAIKGQHVEEVIAAAKAYAPKLLDHGCRIDLIAPDDLAMGAAQTALSEILALPGFNVRTAPRAFEVAEGVARHEAGPQPRVDLEIVVAGNREPIRPADAPLFQRAFSDCKRIVLTELTGGLSDARVFAVHMTVDKSNAGVWPQPAFAKLDRRDKIETEFRNYRQFADAFIPFGLRPNVREVVAGAERALLVGNFVDRSESLWDLARRNVAAQAITALIDETLGGWRDQAYAQDPQERSVALAMMDAGIFNPDRLRSRYREYGRENGVATEFDTLWARLAAVKQSYRQSPIHGDLHGENVRVRNGQAIVIDLASVSRGPLTSDLAALEVWMAFELPPESSKKEYKNPLWAQEIDRLYTPKAFQHPPGPCEPTSEHCWLATVVRQIRQKGIAVQSCATEYQTAVAVQLLRRCQWDGHESAEHFRREHGYVVAVRLIEDILARGGRSE